MTDSGEQRWQVNERPPSPSDSLWTPSRRSMVMGAGGVAMAATLAACGGSSPAPSGGDTGSGAAGEPKKGGNFRLGHHIVYPKSTPMNNLFLTMLDRMGVPAEQIGDSTGPLDELTDL